MATFKELGLSSEIMNGLDDLGFTEPSPIQGQAIPFILKSKQDLIALAQTGTGKTAAFSLPILHKIAGNSLSAIILCPTRELCIQISQDIKKYSKYLKDLSVTPVYGGERIDVQIRLLKRGTNIVVGTPGRVHDLIRRKVLKLQDIQWLVLDEADEMLDMGFKDDLDVILGQTPASRQTLLFSATISPAVRSIAKRYMTETKEIVMGEKNMGADKVTHEYYAVQARDRFDALKRILDYLPGVYGIIFCRTRREAQEVSDKLKQSNYHTEALHGEISQDMRTKIMDRFKKKQIRLLVATDVAARGIDVNDLSHVINYNLPDQEEAYTHRSGRTGRASKSGVSISLIGPRDIGKIRRLEKSIGKQFEYKKVPTGEDVCKKQVEGLVSEIEDPGSTDNIDDKYLAELMDRLQKVDKTDLIRYFVSDKLGHLLADCKNSRDFNTAPSKFELGRDSRENPNHVYLKIKVGKANGLDIKAFFGIINSNKNLAGIEIGSINLMSDYSVFSVDKSSSAKVLSALKNSRFRGLDLGISTSSKISGGGFSRNGKFQKAGRRGKSNRSFGKLRSKKRSFKSKKY